MELTDIFDFGQAVKKVYYRALIGRQHLKASLVLINVDDFIENCFEVPDIPIRDKIEFPRLPRWELPLIDLLNKRSLGVGRVWICKSKGVESVPCIIAGLTKKDIYTFCKQLKRSYLMI